MRRSLPLLLSVLAAIAFGSPSTTAAQARAAGSGPTPAQVRAAVRRAKRSRQLWATVNICNTPADPDQIGIRGQMPALGFPARLSMTIQVDYWDATAHAFKPVPGRGAGALVKLGSVSTGFEQGGHTFAFKPAAGLLAGTITFRWQLGKKLLGKITKQTTQGHRSADGGDPPHYSAATCAIP